MLPLLLAAVILGATPEVRLGYPSDGGLAPDASFPDAGEHGQVVDSSEADAGAHAEELVAAKVTVRIEGAKVLPAEVYLDMLRLPRDARPNAAAAAVVLKQMSEYLQRTGFELATVSTTIEGGDVVVHLDEGQIDRLVYMGSLSYQQVRFKLALTLPAMVFNRPLLDRQVRELSESMGMQGVRWELVRTVEVDHAGPQVEKLPQPMDMAMEGASLVHARRPYEVRIRFPSNPRGTGLGINLRTSGADGFEFGLNNRWGDLIADGDRFLISASGGFALRNRLDTGKLYANFSRGYTEMRYDTPLLMKHLRPNLWVENDWLGRQRGDLYLENYWAVTLDAALQMELEVSPGLHFLFGGGFEWRRLFGFTPELGFTPPPTVLDFQDIDNKRLLLRLTCEWVVDPEVIRWDRRHVLEGEARQYLGARGVELGFAEYKYQYVKALGWHDLWVKSRGHYSWGEVTFHDEVSVGDYTRGLFSDQYVPSAINLSLEFRFSITRDLVKVGIFHDLAMFAVPHRDLGTTSVQLADSFGPGLHLLVSDMFQLDLYVPLGFRKGAQFAAGFNLQLQKAF